MRYALLFAAIVLLVAVLVPSPGGDGHGAFDTASGDPASTPSVSLPREPVAVEPLPPSPPAWRLDSTAHARVAGRYLAVRQVGGNNRGPDVERFQAAAGIPPGSAWCAAFASYCVQVAEREQGGVVVSPSYRGGVAQSYIVRAPAVGGVRVSARASVPASEVVAGRYTPRPGDLAVWRVVGSWTGHVGIVESWERTASGPGRCGVVVEGNTGPGGAVGEVVRDGTGVYRKRRCVPAVPPRSGLVLSYFTPVVWS